MKKITAILLVLCLMAALLGGCKKSGGDTASDTSSDSVTSGDDRDAADSGELTNGAFPNLSSFNAVTADGGTFTSEDFMKYDLTAINIWSTTCPPCIDEMPELAKLQKELPDNVNLMTYCIDGENDGKLTNDILTKADFTGTTLVSGDGDLMELTLKVMYTPTTIFVDSNGNIVGKEIIGSGPDLKATYMANINEALEQLGKEAVTV